MALTRRASAARFLGSLVLGAIVASALTALPATSAEAAVVKAPHSDWEVVPEVRSAKPGEKVVLALHAAIQPGWHIYWSNAGDAGLPTTVQWNLPEGMTAGPIQWPSPVRTVTNGVLTYGYEDHATFLFDVATTGSAAAKGPANLKAHVDYLVCDVRVCEPGAADVSTSLPMRDAPVQPDASRASLFTAARAAMPVAMAGWKFSATSTDENYTLVAEAPQTADAVAAASGELYFFASNEAVVEPTAPQHLKVDGNRLTLQLTRSQFNNDIPGRLAGVWHAQKSWGGGVTDMVVDTAMVPAPAPANGTAGATSTALSEQDAAASLGSTALMGILGLAFLGGLILNLMPCVFPVLAIKVVGFVHQAGEARNKVKMHGIAFTAGVLTSFWALAGLLAVLRMGGQQLGWGFQLQSPAFVFVLAVLMLVFALNLSGVFEFGASATGLGSDLAAKSGVAGTFFSGCLATIVATPCAAPFLAPALGAALTLPVVQSFMVFTVIGIGLSLPYLLLSVFPSAVKVLPRPGRWMGTFKQAMAFPLYATVAYLVWVLAGQVAEEDLLSVAIGLVVIAAGTWVWGRWTGPHMKRLTTRLAAIATVMLFVAGGWLAWPRPINHATVNTAAGVVWSKWSPEAVEALRAENRIVYVDFTARWCATCQANKKLVFHSDEVLSTFAGKKIATLRADWTNKDPAITAELAKYRRSAIPFNLVYLPGKAEPIILPEILTPDIVLSAVGRTASS